MTSTTTSYLFVPGDRLERIAKAIDAGAGAVIIDLEDAVAPAAKKAALADLAANWNGFAERAAARGVTLMLRINAAGTEWHEAEIAACGAFKAEHIVLPKADSSKAVGRVREVAPSASIYPLIESAEGFERLREIARSEGVTRLLFGSIDLMLDLGISDSDIPLHYFRSMIVLESRLAGLAPPVDGVCVDLANTDTLKAEVQRARRFGFGAKLLIHPKQIGEVEEGFRPSAEETDWAERIVAAVAASNGAAVAVDGKMVDRPVLLQAERILASGRDRAR